MQWNPTRSDTHMGEALVDFTKSMVEQGFMKQEDSVLAEAWVADLTREGYKFPPQAENSGFHWSQGSKELMAAFSKKGSSNAAASLAAAGAPSLQLLQTNEPSAKDEQVCFRNF